MENTHACLYVNVLWPKTFLDLIRINLIKGWQYWSAREYLPVFVYVYCIFYV